MFGSIAGLYLNFALWGNAEGIANAAIEGGTHKIQSAPVNFVYNKVRKAMGKEAVADGLGYTLKFAKSHGVKAVLGKAIAGYFFNPYVGIAKGIAGASVGFRKGEIDADYNRQALNVDNTMSYHLNDQFSAINNINLNSMENTSNQISKILSSGNLAEELLEQVLRRG